MTKQHEKNVPIIWNELEQISW